MAGSQTARFRIPVYETLQSPAREIARFPSVINAIQVVQAEPIRSVLAARPEQLEIFSSALSEDSSVGVDLCLSTVSRGQEKEGVVVGFRSAIFCLMAFVVATSSGSAGAESAWVAQIGYGMPATLHVPSVTPASDAGNPSGAGVRVAFGKLLTRAKTAGTIVQRRPARTVVIRAVGVDHRIGLQQSGFGQIMTGAVSGQFNTITLSQHGAGQGAFIFQSGSRNSANAAQR